MPQLATLRIPLYTFPPWVEASPLSPLSPLAFCRAHRRLLQPDEMCFRRWFVISHRHISFISFHFICFRFISFPFAVCIVALSLFCYSIMNTATHFTARLKKKKQPKNKKHGAWLTQSSQGISAEFSKFLQNSFNGKVEDLSFLSMPTASYTDFDFIYYH